MSARREGARRLTSERSLAASHVSFSCWTASTELEQPGHTFGKREIVIGFSSAKHRSGFGPCNQRGAGVAADQLVFGVAVDAFLTAAEGLSSPSCRGDQATLIGQPNLNTLPDSLCCEEINKWPR
jgi:hypothetical protein